jgi:hypothetical protein
MYCPVTKMILFLSLLTNPFNLRRNRGAFQFVADFTPGVMS